MLLAASFAGRWGSPADFAKNTLLLLVGLWIIWWGISRVVRFNLLAYFLIPVMLSLVMGAGQLLRQPNSFYRLNGYAVVVALLLFLAWPFLAWRGARAASISDSSAGAPHSEGPPALQ